MLKYLSRLPSNAVLDQLKPIALVDCCAELPLLTDQSLYSVPMLDSIAPEIVQIQQGVKPNNTVMSWCFVP